MAIAGMRASSPSGAGEPATGPIRRAGPPRPFLLQVKGDWQAAAAAWGRLGCPYEQARALADGDMPARLAALEIFDRLGAAPAAAALRQRMRVEGCAGFRAAPGPQPARTRSA